MIKINIIKEGKDYKQITVTGHSTRAEYGYDIVCAGVSVISIGIINGLTEICNIKTFEIVVKDGYLQLTILPNDNKNEVYIINLFLDTLLLTYKQLSEAYPKDIKMTIEEF